jgi:tetratricopeptide (TPR) repeat protein
MEEEDQSKAEAVIQRFLAMSKLNQDPGVMLRAIQAEKKRFPVEPTLWVLEGWMLSQTGDFPAATKSLEKALRLNPKSAWAHFHMGRMLAEQGRHREAVAAFGAALKLKPKRPDFWLEKAFSEDEVGDIPPAYDSYERAISLGDKTGWGWCGKAKIFTHLNRLNDALEAARMAQKLDPSEEDFKRMEQVILDRMSIW